MKIDDLFELNSDQKKLLDDISALCGIKRETINLIWQYTYFVSYLNILENKQSNIFQLQIPFLGRIIMRYNQDTKEFEDNWAIINESFKQSIKDIKNGRDTGLINFFQKNFIHKIIDQIEES